MDQPGETDGWMDGWTSSNGRRWAAVRINAGHRHRGPGRSAVGVGRRRGRGEGGGQELPVLWVPLERPLGPRGGGGTPRATVMPFRSRRYS